MLFLSVLLFILLIYVVFCFLPSVVMFYTIFFPVGPKDKPEPKKSYYLPFAGVLEKAVTKLKALPTREVAITARDGVLLKGDYISGGFRKTAILFHGYHGTPMSNCAYLGAALWDQGYNLLFIHQRAHGKSGGKYTAVGCLEQFDVLDWVRWAAQDPDTSDLILCGVSMGASAISFASDKITEPKVKALVLDCGFTSCFRQFQRDCTKWHVPWWSVLPQLGLFYRLFFGCSMKTSTTDSLSNATVPAFFLHGMADSSVPFSDGQANFDACASKKESLFLAEAEHTCTLLQGGQPALDRLFAFLNSYIS